MFFFFGVILWWHRARRNRQRCKRCSESLFRRISTSSLLWV